MSLFVIADLHLSHSVDKAMDIFPGWENYVERIKTHWTREVGPDDTVVVAGDISWGMTLQEALADYQFIDALPGRKIILKGNHDYYFTSTGKLRTFLKDNGIHTIDLLHNNSYLVEGKALCGTRGWVFPQLEGTLGPDDAKVLAREVGRLRLSLDARDKAADETIVFLHYPPVYKDFGCDDMLAVLHEYGIKRCYYGHIHGEGARFAVDGVVDGIDFRLVAGDYLKFKPLKII